MYLALSPRNQGYRWSSNAFYGSSHSIRYCLGQDCCFEFKVSSFPDCTWKTKLSQGIQARHTQIGTKEEVRTVSIWHQKSGRRRTLRKIFYKRTCEFSIKICSPNHSYSKCGIWGQNPKNFHLQIFRCFLGMLNFNFVIYITPKYWANFSRQQV